MHTEFTLRGAAQTLAQTPVPDRHSTAFSELNKLNGEIWRLQGILSLKQTPPMFTLAAADARLSELQTKCRANGIDPQVEAQAKQAAALTAPVAAPAIVALTALTAPDTNTATHFLSLSAADRQQFCQDGGKLLRAEFEKLTPAARTAFIRSGGKLCDPVVKKANPGPIVGNVATRAQFDALSHPERNAFIRSGGKLTD